MRQAQSVPNNNAGPPGAVQEIASHKSFAEAFKSSGSAIKIGRYAGLSAPLTFGYTPSNNLVYYDLSNGAGNPFSTFRNRLDPGKPSCSGFNCGPNDAGCYSNGGSIKVKACQLTSLNTTVCAAS